MKDTIIMKTTSKEEHTNHHPYHKAFDPSSPLSVTLQQVPWPQGYKPVQLPKYNGSVDPTQFLMIYEVTIASAGVDDPIMAKSFIMACEGPVATWYSYLPRRSITSWSDLKNKLRQDFQGFRRDDSLSSR
jgi:hypothetical protein